MALDLGDRRPARARRRGRRTCSSRTSSTGRAPARTSSRELNARRDELLATGVDAVRDLARQPLVARRLAAGAGHRGAAPLRLDRRGRARPRHRAGVPRAARRRPTSRLRRRRRRHHPRRMAIRRIRGFGLRHARRVPRARSRSALRRRGASSPRCRRASRFGSEFIADGGDGDGEPAAGDHLQAVYRFWLVGHQLGARRGAVDRPVQLPAARRPAGRPRRLAVRPRRSGRSTPPSARSSPGTCSSSATIVAAGLLTYGWLRDARRCRPAAAAVGGLAFAIAPYRLAQSGDAPPRLDRRAPAARPLRLRALAVGRRRAARAHLWGALAAAVAVVSIPLSGQPHLALGVDPVRRRLRRACAPRRVAAAWAVAGLVGAVGVGLAVHLTIVRDSAESGGRSLAGGRRVLGRLARPRQPLAARRARAVRLPRLAPPRARRRRRRPPLAGAATRALAARPRRRRGHPARARARDEPAALRVALGHLPAASLPARPRPADADRRPGARGARGGRRRAPDRRVGPARGRGRRRAARAVAADLLVFPLVVVGADPDNAAYAALRDRARRAGARAAACSSPAIHYGSVYDYYQLQAPRERPGGYSTLVPQHGRSTSSSSTTASRAACGSPGDEETLRRPRHRERRPSTPGMYAAGRRPGRRGSAGRASLEHGFSPARPRRARSPSSRAGRAAAPRRPLPVPEPRADGRTSARAGNGRT